MKKTFLILIVFILSLSVVSAIPLYDVDIAKPGGLCSLYCTDKEANQGDKATAWVSIKNVGSTGSMKVECGIYDIVELRDWGYSPATFSLFPGTEVVVPSCVETQSFVQTQIIEIEAGKSKLVKFQVITPSTNPDKTYNWFCQAFQTCWSPGVDIGLTDYDVENFDVLNIGRVSATCDDAVQNQDESDRDCGGICLGCANDDSCRINGDCLSKFCSNGVCKPNPSTCGNGRCDSSENVLSCPIDCLVNPICGNGVCDATESITSCPVDCKNDPNFQKAVVVLLIVFGVIILIVLFTLVFRRVRR